MASYVNVPVDELQIDDRVQNLGTLVRDVTDHDSLEGYVVAVFERRGEENLILRKSGTLMKVRVADSTYAEDSSTHFRTPELP